MKGVYWARRVPFIALGLTVLSTLLVSNATHANTAERDYTGLRVQIDNDLFARTGRDRDYTGGLAVSVSGRAAQDGLGSLDPALSALDKVLGLEVQGASNVRHARQVGVMVFTPNDTLQSQEQPADRPYASLLFMANGRMQVANDNTSAIFSSFSVGALGLSLAESVHGAVHDIVGSERPRGYSHQISAGGELTARYTVAKQQLWISTPSSTFDLKTTVQASVGYLTETSAAISMRIGRFSTPWWGFNPELTDYLAAPAPIVEGNRSRMDTFFYVGARIKARAYNAFLQGQFRHSDVRHGSDDVEPLIAEAWVGVTSQVGQTEVSYTLNYQTAEVRHGSAARDYVWGGVQISHRFGKR